MSLFHPIARSSQRVDCLTPSNEPKQRFHALPMPQSPPPKLLSPPLSPKRPYDEHIKDVKVHYVSSSKPFKIEDFHSYKLTISPWTDLKNYKRHHHQFLKLYAVISEKEQLLLQQLYPTRRARKRATQDLEDSETDRVRTRRNVKDTPVSRSLLENESSPSPKKRKTLTSNTTAISVQQQALIDENIPDYSPLHSTLPANNAKCLRVEWKGQPMDLSSDPNKDKLHPAELTLASILRLPCNVYLDSKRRLFYEKVSRLKNGMQFRRTDAQKACRIDVNKASRLFAAYEKVGWLSDKHFLQFV